MAQQPKSAKQLESELHAAQDAAKKIENDLAEARKAEDEKIARQKAAAEKRARKNRIAKNAEFKILAIDYEDYIEQPDSKKASMPSTHSIPTAPKQPVSVINPPAPKQETSLWAWLMKKD